MLIIDNIRFARPDAYKAGLVEEDGNLLATKQMPSFTAVRKDEGVEAVGAGDETRAAGQPAGETED